MVVRLPRRQEHRRRCQGAAGGPISMRSKPRTTRRASEVAGPRAPCARQPRQARPQNRTGTVPAVAGISSCCSCPARPSTARLEADPSLIEAGVEQKVILATPDHADRLLRRRRLRWNQQALTENAQQISALGKELYERICVLTVITGRPRQAPRQRRRRLQQVGVDAGVARCWFRRAKVRDLKAAPEDRELRELARWTTLRASCQPGLQALPGGGGTD